VKALSEIKELIERLDPPPYLQILTKSRPIAITIPSLIEWIVENRILE
jgi:hypothetical protein